MLHSISGTMTHHAYGKTNFEREKASGAGSLDQDYSVGIDPASGVFFNSDYRRHEDLKEMLDSNKDNLKLEAMKRIIGMIAKGRDASSLFPAVVKNVVSKNIELKKLVYSYLERYAEEKEDLALLSISTFQRALKEPNQLIRAGALRVLSGIRVSMIAPIVMIAIRDAAADMSPYVRKTAAHAIPKLYSLDNDTKPELIVIIEKLLADRTVLVIGSAVMAFTKVCPERVDLIHKVYLKLCALLGDVDEWGQVIIVNMLTRYARTQFTDPCKNDKDNGDRAFYDSESEASDKENTPTLDPDHRLLLRSARPLLQSRNAAVVMAVAQMYHHIGPKSETIAAVKALVRLLRSNPEVQELVLKTILTMTVTRKGAFDVYLKSFFVRTSDSTRIKLLKLNILTNIANESNISIILRELETYISSYDDDFVAATIQAIGRCACFITAVTDTCLSGLVTLLSNKNEVVVAESVVVIKRLLQTQAANPKEIIQQMIRLLDSIDVAQARASIIWLLGEHCRDIPTASNVLKRAAKSFSNEEDIVKLQVLNLAVKLYISDKEQYDLLCQYIFNLSKYDQNYDIRDRARLLRNFIDNPSNKLAASAAKIFLSCKPAPTYRTSEESDLYQLGSLSHSINSKANGYEPLPPWPEVAPPNVREVEPAQVVSTQSEAKLEKIFHSWETESSSELSEEAEGSGESDESSESDNKSSSSDEHTSSSSDSSSGDEDDEDEEEEEEEEDSSLETEEGDNVILTEPEAEKLFDNVPQKKTEKSNLDLLLDLEMNDQNFGGGPILTPSLGGFLSPVTSVTNNVQAIQVVPSVDIPIKTSEVLNRINGKGLSISYRFTRNPHLFSPSMVNLNLVFTNSTSEEISDIRVGEKTLSPGMSVHEFACITSLNPNSSLPGTLGIDFNDSLHPANLQIISSLGSSNICLKPDVGELLRPVTMSEEYFLKEQIKLKGMNEHVGIVSCKETNLKQKIYQAANLGLCPSHDNDLRFAGQTLTSSSLVLVSATRKDVEVTITVNCEKLVLGSMLLNTLKSVLQ
ncbi:PREDICTED: AP-3 complex subunit beta-2 [Nicrophorus vespilloides]|uniref:AP-3 complex subunit beta n=1 Tax=Nicrophorus vespilloides TaxID=110193 RepID=A0ABM1MCU2_NICVS|nr:PREDICTED: AP-3 complex subunit beta-2 [Nicrophorus vespilloides]